MDCMHMTLVRPMSPPGAIRNDDDDDMKRVPAFQPYVQKIFLVALLCSSWYLK